jgi:cardiolipin synthase A/B
MNQHAEQHREQIFFRGEDYFAALLHDIAHAQHSIDLETYIFELDPLGKQVLQALHQAAQRGIKVRVMVDGAGISQWSGHFITNLEKAGGQTRIFHPFPWRLWQWSRACVRVPAILKAIYLVLKINSRNHRKDCIIDNKIVYVGGFNIIQAYITEKGNKGWRDTGVRLENVDVSDLAIAFNSAWEHMTVNERLRQIFRHIYTNPLFRLNHGRHRRRVLYKNLLHRIRNCKKRIWITNAYFVPDNFLLRLLQHAAMAGVDVRILLPRKSDISFMPWASQAFYGRLLKAGARIFEYLPTILHAKTLILDDWMLVGSSNLNHRSLLHDLEIDVNIKLADAKKVLAVQFEKDLELSREITLATRQKPPLYQRLIGSILLYLKYII